MNNTTLRSPGLVRRFSLACVTTALATAFALWAGLASAQLAPPNGLPDRGVLRLQLGKNVASGGLHVPKRFIHEPSGLSQAILRSGSCGLVLGGPSALATLSAAGGNGALGLGTGSIGVFDGATGVPCSRISASEGESVTLNLGADLAASPLVNANAFWRLDLDIEVKQNAEFLLQILSRNAVTAEFRLRTGSSIVAGEGSQSPGSPDGILNCSARSDSGPDSGALDNCRWVVNALGQGFRLIALQGEGSLEGGGDFVDPYAKNSLIYLTEGAVGALGCESTNVPQDTQTGTIGDGVNTAQCGVTRIDPTGLGGSCTTAIGYLFRNIDGVAEGCEILKSPGEQLAASIAITFPPETATTLGAEPFTAIRFSDGAGGLVSFVPERCIGTVVTDRNGNLTILEVLSVPNFVPDVVTSTPQKDWACVLDNGQNYLGSGSMQVSQTLLFWGDIEFSRRR